MAANKIIVTSDGGNVAAWPQKSDKQIFIIYFCCDHCHCPAPFTGVIRLGVTWVRVFRGCGHAATFKVDMNFIRGHAALRPRL